MPIHERRQHFRIEDHIYFEYRIINPGEFCSDLSISKELLGEHGQKYVEATQYFHNINYELTELTQAIAIKEPAFAHYLNLLNAKIDYLSRLMLMSDSRQLHKVNISLSGMAFKAPTPIKEESLLKMVLYTKPKMLPIIIDAVVVYCKYQSDTHYHTSVEFKDLTPEQEQILSQHILLVQAQVRGD